MNEGWRRMRLRDLCQSIDYGLTASAEVSATGVKFLRITDIVRGRIDWNTVPWVTAEAAVDGRYALRHGDLVIARTGATTGVSTYISHPPDALFASYLVRFAIAADYDSRFVGYVLKGRQWWNYVNAVLGDKSAQPNASARTLAEAWLDVPPLAEQRAIAEMLGALDDKIEANESLLRLDEGVVDAVWRQVQHPFIPLGDIASDLRVTIDPSGLLGSTVDHYSIPAFDGGSIPERVEAGSIRSAKQVIADDSVLISRLNPRISRVWFAVIDDRVPALCSTEFLVLRPKAGYSVEDIWGAARAEDARTAMAARATGTSGSRQRIRPADAMSILVPDPAALSEQSRALAAASVAHTSGLRFESARLASLRDTLLPKLISGQLRVRDAEQVVEAAV